MNSIKNLFKISKGKKAIETNLSNLRYIQIEDLRGDSNIKFATEAKENIICKKNDVLIAWDGANAGTVGYGLEGVIGSTIAKLIPTNSNISTDYCGRFLQSKFKYLRENCTGATIPHISRSSLENLKIPLPPLEVQKKIASILDKADEIRQKNKAIIAKYNELTQSIFLEIFGDLVNNQKQWEIVNFGKIFKSLRYGVSSPPEYSEKGIPFIRATNIKNGTVVSKGLVYISEQEANKILKCKLNEGDLIVVRSGANTGDCSRIPKEYAGSYGGFDIIIEIEEPYSTFYNFLLNTKAGKAVLDPLTRRAGQPHINSKQLTDLNVVLPPIELQKKFADQVELIEKQKSLAEESLKKSEELFDSLLDKAFKGELVK